MPTHSSIARIQRRTIFSLLGLALAWLVFVWPTHPVLAVAGLVVIAVGHSFLLALQFTLMVVVGYTEARQRPTPTQVARAWLAEVRVAALVFGWRQPFRWRRLPDSVLPALLPPEAPTGATGIVFIHGFACNRGFWTPWMQKARERGIDYVAVNLEPPFGSIDDYPFIIEDAVQRLIQATGRPPVLVCHSMGGLAARAWLRAFDDAAKRVAHIVTIGSPHGGTWIARFSPVYNARQMRLASPWIVSLGRHTPGALFTCWYTLCDNIVFPPSTATLSGADNRLLPMAAHVDLAFHEEVMAHTFALIADL